MRLQAHHKLFVTYALLIVVVIGSLAVAVAPTLRQQLLDQARSDLERELSLARDVYDARPDASPDSLARRLGQLSEHRVTVIARNGAVLGDSGVEPEEVGELENHADRPEFISALREGTGIAVRYSASVDEELLYAASVTDQGPILRFAMGIREVEDAVAGVRRRILEVGAVALVLAGLLALGVSKVVTLPLRRMQAVAGALARGDLSPRVRTERGDELGDLGRALDALADGLERRLAQLHEEREETETLIDSMSEGVLAVESDGMIRRLNPSAREIFRLPGHFQGGPPEEISRRREFLDLVRRATQGEAVGPVEVSQDDRYLLVTAEPLPRGGAVISVLDITEPRRLEGVRRDFVANASHELKTPLTVIRGHSETLLDEDLPSELRGRFTRTLDESVRRLQGILDDLLDLSRIESGGWVPQPEALDLEAVVREAWEPVAAEAQERGVLFDVHVASEAERVWADSSALQQILSNLFSNALRYTPEGGRIEVEAWTGTDDGWTILEVRDTGQGIPSSHLPRIFERFYRVDPARSREAGGTGLGLSIVRHLVERHGGTVTARSELGRGTAIRLALPHSPQG